MIILPLVGTADVKHLRGHIGTFQTILAMVYLFIIVTLSCVLCIILLHTGGRKNLSFSLTQASTLKSTGAVDRVEITGAMTADG